MRLSDENIKGVVAHLKRFRKAPCPVCSSEKWNVSDTLFELPEYEFRSPWGKFPLKSPLLGTPSLTPLIGSEPDAGSYEYPPITTGYKFEPRAQVFPVIPVTCVTCGYVYLLSGIALGIVPK
jgi:hypothetical protein